MKRVALACALMLFWGTPLFAVNFQDDFESGMGNWTQFGGAGPLGLDTSGFHNHTPGGTNAAQQFPAIANGTGFASYHNFGLTTGGIAVEAWMWEDAPIDYFDPVAGAITLARENVSGAPSFSDYLRIGVEQFSGQNVNYMIRTAAGGYQNTGVPRKAGWTRFNILADGGVGGTVRFYIDGVQVGTSTRVQADFSTIILGQNFNNHNNWWYDDISVTPEPAALALLGLGGLMLRRRRAVA